MTALLKYDAARQARRTSRDIGREAWLFAARATFAPGEREECWVCGKFKSIAQAHHTVPLTSQYDRSAPLPEHRYVWLCPNHHVMAHLYIMADGRSMTAAAMDARDKTTSALNPDLSEDEWQKMLRLMRWAAEVND